MTEITIAAEIKCSAAAAAAATRLPLYKRSAVGRRAVTSRRQDRGAGEGSEVRMGQHFLFHCRIPQYIWSLQKPLPACGVGVWGGVKHLAQKFTAIANCHARSNSNHCQLVAILPQIAITVDTIAMQNRTGDVSMPSALDSPAISTRRSRSEWVNIFCFIAEFRSISIHYTCQRDGTETTLLAH
jgi:hypothetical protein